MELAPTAATCDIKAVPAYVTDSDNALKRLSCPTRRNPLGTENATVYSRQRSKAAQPQPNKDSRQVAKPQS